MLYKCRAQQTCQRRGRPTQARATVWAWLTTSHAGRCQCQMAHSEAGVVVDRPGHSAMGRVISQSMSERAVWRVYDTCSKSFILVN